MKLKKISNSKLTLLRKLNRKKHRHEQQFFLIEGQRAVQQLLDNNLIALESLFFDESQNLWQEAYWEQMAHEKESAMINAQDFEAIADTENPQGILALCHMPAEADLSWLASKQGIIVATDAIQDPGNLGTIIRSASWFGAAGLLTGKGTADLFHPKVVRSTAGATGSVPYKNADLNDDLARLEEAGWTIILLDAGTGAESIRHIEARGKAVLVVGNEANGIDAALFKAGRTRGFIPSAPGNKNVESLNASMALSIALYAFSDAID